MKSNLFSFFNLTMLIFFLPYGCQSRERNSKESSNANKTSIEVNEIQNITFFIENSGSLKGYVEGSTQYVDVLTNIANHPDFISDNASRSFFISSGTDSPVRITNLRTSLVPSNFNQTKSNLNQLFKTPQ